MSKISKAIRSFWTELTGSSRGPRNISQIAQAEANEAFGGSNDRFLVDFHPGRFGGSNFQGEQLAVPVADFGMLTPAVSSPEYQEAKVAKIQVKPIDVVNELGHCPQLGECEGLDQKIRMLELKADMISQHYAKQEVVGLIECLKNRKRYDDLNSIGGRSITYREFFCRFDATNQTLIDELCKKHDLVMKDSDIFTPNFPDEAVTVMKDYTDAVVSLTDKKPRFFVIATPDSFREKYADRDPILLAQSPFGFYYYILGAWDSEMILLSEL